jgi:protein-S-isoprenylcysteine O-methyltransferase Ste14
LSTLIQAPTRIEPLNRTESPAPAVVPAARSNLDVVLDAIECVGVFMLYLWLVLRIVAGPARGVANYFLLPSEGIVLVFMLIRRRSKVLTHDPRAWLLAIVATCVPLLVSPTSQSLIPTTIGASLLLTGLFFQIYAKLTLGRSFGCVAANRGLKLGGPYLVVRHPMYAGYLLSHIAFLAMNPSWWNASVYVLCYAIQIPRILTEERLLSEDAEYCEYEARVRYRLIPGVF